MSDEPSEPAKNTPQAPRGEAPPQVTAGYSVKLPSFEGPLDLLLHLIHEHELDIMDIPIAFVTHKYVEYITLMQELNIDVASEYLVMAATLAHIKSRMLLPTPPADQEEDADLEIDPRAELVRRLLEYQKYKQVAEELSTRSVLGRDVFTRGSPAPAAEGPAPLAQVSLFKLLNAFQSVLERAKTTVDHEIDLERFSIADRIIQLADVLRQHQHVRFEELFVGQHTRAELIVTFLALLEMTRLRMTRLFQTAPLDSIFVELAVPDDEIAELAGAAVVSVGSEHAAEARPDDSPAPGADRDGADQDDAESE